MKKDTISTHVFFFPFTWKKSSAKKSFYFKEHRQLKEGAVEAIKTWKYKTYEALDDQNYNELVYFYKPVQAVLYESGHSCIVKAYEKINEEGQTSLKIVASGETYELDVKTLELKLYKSGVGLLILGIVNDRYEKPEQITAINGLSKCVYPYVLPLEEAQKDFFPEKLILQMQDKIRVETFDKPYKEKPMIIGDFLMDLLGPSFTCEKDSVEKDMFFIEPLLSNRMFTLCLYKNPKLLQDIKNKQVKDQFLTQFMVFSRKEKLADVSYLELPKVMYGIGRFALIGITSDDRENRIYNELVTLALVQRATLLHFSTQLAYISALPKAQLVMGIENLYEIYVQFINQIYFHEVTVDMQGSILYENLLKQLRIPKEIKELDFEMREVHEYSSLIQKAQSQIRIDMLTVIGTILVIPTFVTGFFGMNILEDHFIRWWEYADIGLFLNSYVFLPIVVVLLIYSFCTKNHKHYKVWVSLLSICLVISLGILMLKGSGIS